MLNKIFDSEGLARFNCDVLVYGFDPTTGEYLGFNWVRVFKHTGIPGSSTVVKPPNENEKNKVFVFNGVSWDKVDDFRGSLIRNKETKKISLLSSIGPLSNEYEFL